MKGDNIYMNSRYEDILNNLVKYGETSELIKVVVLIGSQSRQSDCADTIYLNRIECT